MGVLRSLLNTPVLIMMFLGIISGISFGAILPVLEPFITGSNDNLNPGLNSSESFYSVVIAIFSVGEFFGGFLSGYRDSKIKYSRKSTLIILTLIGIIGSLMFSICINIWMAIIGRLLTGIWSGGVNVTMRNIFNSSFKKKDLTIPMAVSAFLTTLAMMISPGIAGLLEKLPAHGFGVFQIDQYRSPSWFVCFVITISLPVLVFILPTDSPIMPSTSENLLPSNNTLTNYNLLPEVPEKIDINSCIDLNISEINDIKVMKNTKIKYWDTGNTDTGIVLCLLYCFFTFSFGFTVIECMATPLMNDQFGTDIGPSSLLYVVIGSVSALSFLILLVADKSHWITDSQAILISIFLFLAGSVSLFDYQTFRNDPCQEFSCSYDPNFEGCNITSLESSCNNLSGCVWNQKSCDICPPICHNPSRVINLYQMYAGFICINVQYVLGRITSAALYSKFMQSQQQSFMQSILLSVGTVGRIIGPVVAISAYDAFSHRTFFLMSLMAGMCLICLIMFSLHYKKIREQEIKLENYTVICVNSKQIEEENEIGFLN